MKESPSPVIDSALSFENVTIAYERPFAGEIIAAVDLTFSVKQREFVCILGPSGSGKSSALKVAAGLLQPISGSVRSVGEVVADPSPERSLVFQDLALFPWLTALDNVAFGPRHAGISKTQSRTIAVNYLDLVGLSWAAKQYPWQLSGGEQQRVALARAVAAEPRLLLLDEPFGQTDAITRQTLREVLCELWERLDISVLMVTHDIEEALYLSDRILVMTGKPGKVLSERISNLPRPRTPSLFRSQDFQSLRWAIQDELDAHSLRS